MVAAQIIAIVAFSISWIWWVTLIIGDICFVLLQVIWCCRQQQNGLYLSAAISTVAAISCMIAGIVMLVVWKDRKLCEVWRLTGQKNDRYYDDDDYSNLPTNDYYYRKNDNCEEGIWAAVAFVTALLWFATTGCILYFVKSGRYTKWEEKLQAAADSTTVANTTAIEMGTVQHHQNDHDHDEQQEQQSTIAVATTSAIIAATSYVLPDIPNKIDDVL